MNEGNQIIYKHTLSSLKIEDNDTLLEIGMANGYFIKKVLSHAKGLKYHGCDYSEEMIAQAKLLNKPFTDLGQAEFHLSKAIALPYDDCKFDEVFTVNTLYFWEDPIRILSEIRRVLKSRGRLAIAIRPKSCLKEYPFAKYGFKMYSKNELQELLSENDFSINSTIEEREPPQIIDEKEYEVNTLIVVAEKSNN